MKKNTAEQGQAMITLLFIAVIGITITMAAIIMMYINTLSSLQYQSGEMAYQAAESGAQNALLRLLRDPTYRGETMPASSGGASGSAVITVIGDGSAGNPFIISSSAQLSNFKRNVEVQATYDINSYNTKVTVTSRKETY